MKEIALLIQMCAAGLCTPTEAAQLDRAFEQCRTASSLVDCLYRTAARRRDGAPR